MMPRFRHDCNRCVLVGITEKHDHYVCDTQDEYFGPTLVARYSDDGPDYLSSSTRVMSRFGLERSPLAVTYALWEKLYAPSARTVV